MTAQLARDQVPEKVGEHAAPIREWAFSECRAESLPSLKNSRFVIHAPQALGNERNELIPECHFDRLLHGLVHVLVHARKNLLFPGGSSVEAPGVEDGARRGQERTHADNTATLHVVGHRQDGQKRSPADTDCSTVATALRDAAEGYERTGDERRLRLALLDVLRSLDEGEVE